MNTIKLTHEQLQNLTYEIASSLSEIEETSEAFNILFSKAAEEAYLIYKNEYKEEPDFDFDPEFSELISESLVKLLITQYDAFYISEDVDRYGNVNSARFFSIKDEERITLVNDVTGVVYG